MRKSWIRFVNGEEPWDGMGFFAFGPNGKCRGVGEDEVAVRRRVGHCRVLEDVGDCAALDGVVAALATGRLSFLN